MGVGVELGVRVDVNVDVLTYVIVGGFGVGVRVLVGGVPVGVLLGGQLASEVVPLARIIQLPAPWGNMTSMIPIVKLPHRLT